ncbi:MnmC family methyltransferase [Vulcanococcus limneticus]|uniref:MnmC family methyltransferase n=1 Tax=Vulcanococcus limneticus TaxID=2170428 RepID=UPI000B98FC11|nr:MnmC family methyltransferase [Vulcanococcus limneticus]MCP9791929.1 SAM-dependent methyltransferase [Vulcanococcus limneticus MW73D5]MCP9897363.1 SAM-dependent methyltransferase [Vulcanococcus limneticus Candia 3B3]
MTSSDCGPEGARAAAAAEVGAPGGRLEARRTGDGSLSLWSEDFGEAFHCGRGALAEAHAKFVAPAQLERFAPGSSLQVVDVCVGLGYNSAALLEAAADRGLAVRWWGLELDPRPLQLALADPGFRGLWRPGTVALLEQLRDQGAWHRPAAGAVPGGSRGRWWLGDARQQLAAVLAEARGQCDLVLHDAFSPGHCPQLWSMEFLAALAALLRPDGRLLTYCAAAAVRRSLQLAGLQLASIAAAGEDAADAQGQPPGAGQLWSHGTAASPQALPVLDGRGLPPARILRALGPLELEHLQTRAAEPYRDPSGRAPAAEILAERQRAQGTSTAGSTSAWRRRWGLAP